MTASPASGLGPRELTGRARGHVVEVPGNRSVLHHAVREPFLAMRAAAARAGIDLEAASSFRDFDRQRTIWNAKFRGERVVHDADGRPVDVMALDPSARVATILLWSALPGASRHHWGTDLDLIDRQALAAGQQVSLTAAEYATGGPFAPLSAWLDRHMRRFGFYRPYASGAGGVRPEPWHLSFAPVARHAERALTVEVLRQAIEGQGVLGEEAILADLTGIHAHYIAAVDRPPRMRSRWATGAA